MKKFLQKIYYGYLVSVLLFTVFSVTVRDEIIEWLSNPNPKQPISNNANAYATETLIRNIFVYSLLGSLIFLVLISIVILFLKRSNAVKKGVAIGVILLVSILFLSIIVVGGFS